MHTFEPARPRIRPYPAYTCTNGSAKNSTVAADILSPVPLYVNGMPLILARYPNLNTSGDRVYNNWMNVGRVGSSASDVQWFSMSDPAGDVSKRASAWEKGLQFLVSFIPKHKKKCRALRAQASRDLRFPVFTGKLQLVL